MRKFKIVKKPVPAAAPIAVPDTSLSFRLIDFHVYDCVPDTNTHSSASENSGADEDSGSVASGGSSDGGARRCGGGGGGGGAATDLNEFRIQMFGINEQGETCSIFVDDYNPFFYVKVDPHWTTATKSAFIRDIKKNLKSRYYENSILADKCEIVEKRKLYGFDGERIINSCLLCLRTRPL